MLLTSMCVCVFVRAVEGNLEQYMRQKNNKTTSTTIRFQDIGIYLSFVCVAIYTNTAHVYASPGSIYNVYRHNSTKCQTLKYYFLTMYNVRTNTHTYSDRGVFILNANARLLHYFGVICMPIASIHTNPHNFISMREM